MNGQGTIYDHLKNGMPAVVKELPDWIDPERFRRTLFWLIQSNPALQKMQPRSVLDGCMKAAMDGLLLDGKEAALIPHQGVARYSPMIGGLMKLARRSKQFRAIHVHPVYQNDEIDAVLGDSPHISHRPLFFGDRGALIGAYAIVETQGGWREYEVMSKVDIDKVREASPSSNSPAWRDWEDQMACKAVFRRLWKRMDHDVDQLDSAIHRDDEGFTLDEPPIKDVTPPKAAPKPVEAKPAASQKRSQPEHRPEPEASAGDIPAEVAEFLRMIGEPNVDRKSWDEWLILDVLPLTGDVAVEETEAFVQALEWVQTSNGLQAWGAPVFEDWRATVRDAIAADHEEGGQ